MIIQTRPVDNSDGSTSFVGPCSKACWSVGKEGSIVSERPHYEIKLGFVEAEIHCKESC